jgi:hypothetical protein
MIFFFIYFALVPYRTPIARRPKKGARRPGGGGLAAFAF